MRGFIFLLFTFVATIEVCAQDSLATVYFYRTSSPVGALISYKLVHEAVVVGKIKPGSTFLYYCKPGLQTFSATTESDAFIKLDIKQGETYFVECSVGVGAVVGTPSFRQVARQQARKDIMKINPILAAQIKSDNIASLVPTDTVRALQNLYHRKHKSGTFTSVFFWALAVTEIGLTASSYNANSGGYVLAGVFGIVALSGGGQASKYSTAKLDMLLDDYMSGKPLPKTVKRKLKRKDFR